MFKNLALATGALTMIAGFAMAQDVQQTTTASQSVTTPGGPDINAQAAQAQAQARANAKPGEAYEWSVDSSTTHVPARPVVVAPPPAVVEHHTSSTTTTTTGGDQ
jgi:hypothetical protein